MSPQKLEAGEEDLIERIVLSNRPVVFLFGSALTAPVAQRDPGVPGVAAIVEMIRSALGDRTDPALEQALAEGDHSAAYRVGFGALLRRRGQDAVNRIVREAVLEAHRPLSQQDRAAVLQEHPEDHRKACKNLLAHTEQWHALSPHLAALGRLLRSNEERFPTVLTTNFDPLIELSVRLAGGSARRTVLVRDGNPESHGGEGIHIIYLHGYWYGSDTLHTDVQLGRGRPQLSKTLTRWLNRSLLVVLGYAGWDDILMSSLQEVAADDGLHPDIAWASYRNRDARVALQLTNAHERVQFYENVDLRRLIPRIEDRLNHTETRPHGPPEDTPSTNLTTLSVPTGQIHDSTSEPLASSATSLASTVDDILQGAGAWGRYRPYPVKIVDALEALTRARETRRDVTPLERQEQQKGIDRLVGALKQTASPRTGDVVVGARLVTVVGKGNFGVVWQATEIDSGKSVAVKIFDSDRLGLSLALYHFRRGVRAMEHLCSAEDRPQSIVALLRTDTAKLAFSMQFVESGCLENIRSRGWSTGKKLEVFHELCTAVRFAHRHGVLHRDIKPLNVIIGANGLPVLTDFDIADLLFAGTQTTLASGTVSYSAPEQLSHNTRRDATGDVYSLGRVLHFLLAEQTPPLVFQPELALQGLMDLTEDRAPIGLIRIIYKCTKLEPDERYAHVDELLVDLGNALSNPQKVGTAIKRLRKRKPEQRNQGAGQKTWWALAIVVALAGATIALRFSPSQIDDRNAPIASAIAASPPNGTAQHHVIITVTSDPPGANVSVDGKAYGQTPADIEWWGDQAAPGREVNFVLQKDGFEKATVPRSINGERLTVDVQLMPNGSLAKQALEVATTVLVSLKSTPPGAMVIVGEREYGPTPTQVEWTGPEAQLGREVTFRFERTGYRDLTVTRQIRGDRLEVEAPPMDPIPVSRPGRSQRNQAPERQ